MVYYAHSKNRVGAWHPLREHLTAVSRLAAEFAADFPWREEAALAGLLHDLGKYGDRFQARLHGEDQGLDHWSPGAWLALFEHRAVAAALAIQGHHVGLQRLSKDALRALNPHTLASQHPLQLSLTEVNQEVLKTRFAADTLEARASEVMICGTSTESRIDRMLDVRMLFSTLVDADFLDTEAHFEGDATGKRHRTRGPELQPSRALATLLAHVDQIQTGTGADPKLVKVRADLRRNCAEAAELSTGLFTLTAPTGSGKTLSMLAFALAHAAQHGLRRVILVIPYLSILEQTVAVYRRIFTEADFGADFLLEHHSLAGLGKERCETDAESEQHAEQSAERRRRLLAENWDAPIVVTTSVQFLESMFSNRPSVCRKLHRLGRSVILFDEVQTLPAPLAVPTLASLSHLTHAYGSTVVFATATQPAFTHLHPHVAEHVPQGWQPREIVPMPQRLFEPLRRVRVSWGDPDRGVSWTDLAGELPDRVLCVVNLKRHAKALWEALADSNTFHLSTNLCPTHRQHLLETVRAQLASGDRVRLIATQCVEAGVDVDFPVVYRAYGPLEAIVQASGRCNREGKLPGLGTVRVFMPEDEGYPRGGYEQATQVTKMLLKRSGDCRIDLDNPAIIMDYYRELYDIAKPEAACKTKEIFDHGKAGCFPEVAQCYRLIEQDTINVVVPYFGALELYEELRRLAEQDGLSRAFIQRARPITVSLFRPKPEHALWDVLLPVLAFRSGRRHRQDEWYIAAASEHYHPQLGFVPPVSLSVWIG